jgi:hypothetical protein
MSKDMTKGAEAMVSEGPTIQVNGEEYTMKRLGVRHTFAFAKIVAGGAAYLGAEVGNILQQGDSAEAIGQLILLGLPYSEKQSMKLLADVIGVSEEDFNDPEKFPIGSEIEIIEGLVEHQDLKAFFSKLKGLMEGPALKSFLNKQETSSSDK